MPPGLYNGERPPQGTFKFLYTWAGLSQFSTDDNSVIVAPRVTANCPPDVGVANLYTPIIDRASSSKSDLALLTGDSISLAVHTYVITVVTVMEADPICWAVNETDLCADTCHRVQPDGACAIQDITSSSDGSTYKEEVGMVRF